MIIRSLWRHLTPQFNIVTLVTFSHYGATYRHFSPHTGKWRNVTICGDMWRVDSKKHHKSSHIVTLRNISEGGDMCRLELIQKKRHKSPPIVT